MLAELPNLGYKYLDNYQMEAKMYCIENSYTAAISFRVLLMRSGPGEALVPSGKYLGTHIISVAFVVHC